MTLKSKKATALFIITWLAIAIVSITFAVSVVLKIKEVIL